MKVSISTRTGTVGARARNSSPSSREVRDRPDDPLAPEQLVREGRDVAHVDPGAHDDAALANVSEGGWDEGADGREDDDRVELLGRAGRGVARPGRPERAGELLGLVVARVSGDAPSLRDGDLAHDVRGRSEPVEPDRLGVACEPQRA